MRTGETIRNRRFYTSYPETRIPLVVEDNEVYELVITVNAKKNGQLDLEAYIEPQPIVFREASEQTADKIARRMGRLYKIMDEHIGEWR